MQQEYAIKQLPRRNQAHSKGDITKHFPISLQFE